MPVLVFLALGLVGGVLALEMSFRLARVISDLLLRLDAEAEPSLVAIAGRYDV